ncbi:MAG: sugar transferase, partial [Actinomycetota bacterium]|nr:sugar transferase [Actinomycetota bacterium]
MSRSVPLEAAHSGRAARWTATDVATRARDFVVAAILLLMLAPLLLIVALAVAVSSPGPILFRQSRVGRGRQEFVMLKFRTMALGSDDSSHRELVRSMFVIGDTSAGQKPGDCVWKLVDDERVTAAGRVLRRLSLDELPQLLNVLAGEMSLVGPRPALPWEVELFGARHLARFD